MTPLALSILLHYYVGGGDDFRQGDFTAPAVRDTINVHLYERLLENNSQGDDDRIYRLSERGRVFIDYLLAQPLPVQVWQMPAGVPVDALAGLADYLRLMAHGQSAPEKLRCWADEVERIAGVAPTAGGEQ